MNHDIELTWSPAMAASQEQTKQGMKMEPVMGRD